MKDRKVHPAEHFNWSPGFAKEMEEEFGDDPPGAPEAYTRCWQKKYKQCMMEGTRGGEPVCSEKAFAACNHNMYWHDDPWNLRKHFDEDYK